jgi:hypothetical protein
MHHQDQDTTERQAPKKKPSDSLPPTCHLFPPLLPKKQEKGERKQREEEIYVTRAYRQQVVHILLAYHGDEFLRSRHGEGAGAAKDEGRELIERRSYVQAKAAGAGVALP